MSWRHPRKPPFVVQPFDRGHWSMQGVQLWVPMLEPGPAENWRPWDYAGRVRADATSDRTRVSGRLGWGANESVLDQVDNPIDFAWRPQFSQTNYTVVLLVEMIQTSFDGTPVLAISAPDSGAVRNWLVAWYQAGATKMWLYAPYFAEGGYQIVAVPSSRSLASRDIALLLARGNSAKGTWSLDVFSTSDGHKSASANMAKTAKTGVYPISFGDYPGTTGYAGTSWPHILSACGYFAGCFSSPRMERFARDIFAVHRPQHRPGQRPGQIFYSYTDRSRTGPDRLRFESGAVEVQHLTAAGTVPGVWIQQVAAANGPGTARIRSAGYNLTWQAPGEAVPGEPVEVKIPGHYLLEGAADPNKWARVRVYPRYLTNPAGGGVADAAVALADRYANPIASDDVSAAEAAAGDAETYTVDLYNQSTEMVTGLRVWIDPAVSGIEISDDGAAWVSPTTEADALVLPDLAAKTADTLHVRRTIGAASDSDPKVLTHLRVSYDQLGG